MDSAILILRVGMILVFGAAGVGKLRAQPSFRETLIGFGVPYRLTRLVARVLTAAELVTAAGLFFQVTARWAAVACVLLLAMFIVAVVVALRQGKAVDCNCFGQLSASQIGPRTLLRNAAFGVAAAAIIWKGPGSSMTGWTTDAAAANVVAAIAVIAALGLLIALVGAPRRSSAAMTAFVDGTPHPMSDATHPGEQGAGGVAQAAIPTHQPVIQPGVRVPDFRLQATNGETVTLEDLLARGLPTIIMFASPLCHTCAELVPELGRLNASIGDRITFAVLESAAGDISAFAASHPTPPGLTVMVESGRDVSSRFGMDTIPAGLAIGPDGLPLGPPAQGAIEIEQMISVISGGPTPAPAAPILPITNVGA